MATDKELIGALADIRHNGLQQYGMFDADSFQVECIQDSQTEENIEQTSLWKAFENNYIEKLEMENKNYMNFIQGLGYDSSSIANGELLNQLQELYLDNSKSLHELPCTKAYYNYQGNHYRLFASFKQGQKWLENRDDRLVLAEFENEEDLDKYIEESDARSKK